MQNMTKTKSTRSGSDLTCPHKMSNYYALIKQFQLTIKIRVPWVSVLFNDF